MNCIHATLLWMVRSEVKDKVKAKVRDVVKAVASKCSIPSLGRSVSDQYWFYQCGS